MMKAMIGIKANGGIKMKTNSKKNNVFRYTLSMVIVVLSFALLFGCNSSKTTSELPKVNMHGSFAINYDNLNLTLF